MTFTRKVFFYVAMVAGTWGLIEVVGLIGYGIVNQSFFSKSEVKNKIRAHTSAVGGPRLVEQGAMEWNQSIEVIHPYFGYVLDPQRNPSYARVSDFGFLGNKGLDPLLKRDSHKLVVGIFGGSFAVGTHRAAKTIMAECLKTANKEIVIKNLAAPGYKQPQQLLIFAYLLSLGAEFDIIINIDGFNEVALPPAENIPNGVYPYYPRLWHHRAATVFDPVQLRQSGQISLLRETRKIWANFFNDHKLYRSPTLALFWQLRDQSIANHIVKINLELANRDDPLSSFVKTGSHYTYDREDDLYQDLAIAWKLASIQMKLLAEGNKTRYYHFLQPNQYLPDSKPMSRKERAVSISDDHPYGISVKRGYPLLIAEGQQLSALGVDFTDLTKIFVKMTDELYVDNCCHLNKQGYDLIAWELCRTVSSE